MNPDEKNIPQGPKACKENPALAVASAVSRSTPEELAKALSRAIILFGAEDSFPTRLQLWRLVYRPLLCLFLLASAPGSWSREKRKLWMEVKREVLPLPPQDSFRALPAILLSLDIRLGQHRLFQQFYSFLDMVVQKAEKRAHWHARSTTVAREVFAFCHELRYLLGSCAQAAPQSAPSWKEAWELANTYLEMPRLKAAFEFFHVLNVHELLDYRENGENLKKNISKIYGIDARDILSLAGELINKARLNGEKLSVREAMEKASKQLLDQNKDEIYKEFNTIPLEPPQDDIETLADAARSLYYRRRDLLRNLGLIED